VEQKQKATLPLFYNEIKKSGAKTKGYTSTFYGLLL
jgi:hypothetical protein